MIGKRYAAIGCAALIAGALLAAPHRGYADGNSPAEQPAPAEPVFSSDPQIASAQQAVLTFAKATNLPALKNALSDRSSALIGVITAMPMAYIVEAAPEQLPDAKAAPALKRDFEAYLQSYGIDANKIFGVSAIPAKVQGHGHEFLQGLVPFANRFNGKAPNDKSDDAASQQQALLPARLDFFKFDIVNPTHVKVTPQDPKALHFPGVTTFEALQEDGVWKVDLGDSDKILDTLKKAKRDAAK
ncbi:MAG: hypothetical protein ABIY70_23455 [Capsulimonas sp.]|uniref:hypothetical protein n=1 Tax=Capsulimonas sp. TaxID=2494211 RepID=UPI0032640BCC